MLQKSNVLEGCAGKIALSSLPPALQFISSVSLSQDLVMEICTDLVLFSVPRNVHIFHPVSHIFHPVPHLVLAFFFPLSLVIFTFK